MALSLLQVSLGLLTVLSPSLAWYPPWVPQHYFTCFEWDDVPVDTRIAFPGKYCQDKMGNKYPASGKWGSPAQQTSCCQCLEYTCRPVYVCDYKDPQEQKECEDKQYQQEERGEYYVYWNTSVSDNCCLYCNNTVYKADTVIDTTKLEDKCESEETFVCRKIPGLEKAKIETEFRFGVCCNDGEGLQALNSTALQPATCSERHCIRPEYAPFAVWISSPYTDPRTEKEIEGCDCCKIYDEKLGWILIADKTEFYGDDKEKFECCRGEVVKKIEKPEKKTKKE